MSELHPMGVSAPSKECLEVVHPRFVKQKLREAQAKSWEIVSEIRKGLQEGMTEKDARYLALDLSSKRGVTKHWHQPFVRLGPGTVLTFAQPLQPEYRLQNGDTYYVDLGPVWEDSDSGLGYEGDVGDSFVFGTNPEAEKINHAAHEIFNQTRDEWRKSTLTGDQIYEFVRNCADRRGYQVMAGVEGHRIGHFPHKSYVKAHLAHLSFVPSDALWILEVQLLHPTLKIGAFFEDLL